MIKPKAMSNPSKSHEKYRNVATRTHNRYRQWMIRSLYPELSPHLPNTLGRTVIGYVSLDEKDHFEAVINVRPDLFSFVFICNLQQWANNLLHDLNVLAIVSLDTLGDEDEITYQTLDNFNDDIMSMARSAGLNTLSEERIVKRYNSCAIYLTRRCPLGTTADELPAIMAKKAEARQNQKSSRTGY